MAVDASQNMVTQASDSLSSFGKRVTVQQLDLLDLAVDASFDVIFSSAVFHWIKGHDRLFANLFRALKPGGLLFAQCGGGPNLKRLRERTQVIMSSEQFAPYFRDWKRIWEFPEPEPTAERLRRLGFVEVTTALAPEPTPLPDEQTFRHFLTAVNLHLHLERIPKELHATFLDPLVRQAAQDSPPFLLDYWRLNLQARKP
jgi:trans-aconitate 2-methyltransferase